MHYTTVRIETKVIINFIFILDICVFIFAYYDN